MSPGSENPSFLDNWRTLPEELKLLILEYTVTLSPPYQARLISYYHINDHRYWNFTAFRERVVPLLSLLSVPEIKPLVQEAFYTQHSFRLDYNRKWNTNSQPLTSFVHLSPHSVRRYVRRLHILASGIEKRMFELLEKVPSSLCGLPNLEFLEISFRRLWSSDDVSRGYLDSMEPLGFAVKCLRIAFQHYPMSSSGSADVFETAMLENFTLGAGMRDVDARWTRFVVSSPETELREVESWAAATTIEHHVRWTVKEVFVEGFRNRRYPKFQPTID
ncbi:hypothetical protein EKO04_011067 [Ascochyta lentis]|uniref:Uncharacterized protein n=1 Tax=Ascochyta lentis TaxID=205686 RepID=A0A8H7ITQ9_9PLEO|nr:hypothetical protein EKO04_011067 [Ascochyta lentis]